HSDDDIENESKIIRTGIISIMKFYMQRKIKFDELNSILSFISTTTSNDILVQEMLNFIIALLETSASSELTITFLCEPNMADNLYSLITIKDLATVTKEKTLQIIKYLLASKRVPVQVKSLLRLENNIGFGGIISSLNSNELSVAIVREILNIVTMSDNTIAVDHLNIILTLCSAASLDVRYVAMRKLMSCFIAHPTACKAYSKCYGWHETLAHFFIKTRHRSLSIIKSDQYDTVSPNPRPSLSSTSSLDQLAILTKTGNDSGNISDYLINSAQQLNSDGLLTTQPLPPKVYEISSSPEDPNQPCQVREILLSPITSQEQQQDDENITPRNSLTLSSSSFLSPLITNSSRDSALTGTPEFIRRNTKDNFDSEDLITTTSPSSVSDFDSNAGGDLISSKSNEDFSSVLIRDSARTCQTEPTSPVEKHNDYHSQNGCDLSSRYKSTLNIDDSSNNNTVDGEYNEFMSKLRNILGITSTSCIYDELFKSDVSFDVNAQEYSSSLLEELCETLILAIVMILWKGITGSDDDSWSLRGQIFSALRHLNKEYEFYLPLTYIERRILELSLETCLNDIEQNGGQITPLQDANCRELIKLVEDFLTEDNHLELRISDNLVNDALLVFEENVDYQAPINEQWTEISLTGLNLLLILLENDNVSHCADASVRIHSLLHSRPLNGKEEASYLITCVNRIMSIKSENQEHYPYLIPIMKTLVDKSYYLLQMNVQIPNIPLHKAAPSFLEDFKSYCQTAEWCTFIQKQCQPLSEHYKSMSIKPFKMNMKIWWNNTYEMMMIGIHKRNRQIGEEKLRFQSQILELWRARRRTDQTRYSKFLNLQRLHQDHVDTEWYEKQKYFERERGPWNSFLSNHIRWMLSSRENIHRMRCKLIENSKFDEHEESSRLRDNLDCNTSDEFKKKLFEENLKNKEFLIQKE
ncbi:unnamed protein product, partial [Didymodactylos carnosus]